MKINANLIKVGNIIRHQEKMYLVLNTSIIKPGKGGAFIQVEMRDILSKNKTNHRFRTSDSIEKLNTDEISSTFLFSNDTKLTFMRDDNFEQLEIDKTSYESKFGLLNDGMKVTLEYVDEKIINIRLPKTVEIEIETADAVVKGQTASSSYKPAITNKGLKILVPPHIKQGDKIIIQSDNLEYVEKSKY